MPAEYQTVTTDADPAVSDAELNVLAADGWTVKAAFSPTSYLMERQPPPPVVRAAPKPPTGPQRG